MEYKIYIGGVFIETQNKLEVTNKFTNEVFATTYLAGVNELEQAIIKAENIKQELKDFPSWKKNKALLFIAEQIENQRTHFATLLAYECGKPMKFALGEVDRAVQTFRVAAEESKRLPAETYQLDWTPQGEGKEAIVKYFPVGIVAGIAPFNFPLNLAVHKIGPALAAGCPIILKPARATAISTLELAKIIDKSEFPKGAFSVLPMNREAGNQLVTDERFAKLSFTGSPAVGWKMKSEAGRKKITLELGGNAGCIVTPSANIDEAVKKCIVGGFAFSGQICIHVQRIYVHETLFEDFTKKFVKGVAELRYGDPLSMDTDISVLIDEESAIRVEEWITEAVRNGAKCLHGGKRNGMYVEPTILTNTKPDMKVCCQEVFGPVVTIEKYSEFDEAIKWVNNSEFGLQAGVFTNSISEMNFAFSHIEAGGIIINDVPTFRVDHMPYGGVKNSGFGREGVKYAILEMLEPKLLVKPL